VNRNHFTFSHGLAALHCTNTIALTESSSTLRVKNYLFAHWQEAAQPGKSSRTFV